LGRIEWDNGMSWLPAPADVVGICAEARNPQSEGLIAVGVGSSRKRVCEKVLKEQVEHLVDDYRRPKL
jgi:hypothetical protein